MTPPADLTRYSGNPGGFVAWDGARIFRTNDILAASPTWETIDSGISGDIYDCQFVLVDDTTVGAWLLTSTAVWWCADIEAVAPVWASVLPIATVIANEVPPGSGSVGFKSMAHAPATPGYLIVVTGPVPGDFHYDHAYFWHTHDYGQNWTQIDMDGFTFSNSGATRCYAQAGRFAVAIYPDEPQTVWAVRQAERAGTQGRTAVFISTDLGHTWSKGYEVASPTADGDGAAFLPPLPALTDPSYMVRGNSSAVVYPLFYRSADSWATGTVLTTPAGYLGFTGWWRPNKRFGDVDHVISWAKRTSDGGFDLLESNDQGATWAVLHSSSEAALSATIAGTNTPDNWPSDPDVWVMVRGAGTFSGGPVVQYTDDNFATLDDKEGNLVTLLGTWTAGSAGGFFIPKPVAAGADLSASITRWLRVQAAQQAEFGTPVTPLFALPVTFDYQQGDIEQLAAWEAGTWTATEIVELVAQFATFRLRGALCFEVLPVLLNAGFAAMTPTGLGPYSYAGGAGPSAVGAPSPYTFRFGGDMGDVGSMVQVQDAFMQSLTLTFDMADKVVQFDSRWFGRRIDDNDGAGYAPEAVNLPDGVRLVNGLRATIGVQDADATGGAFDALADFACSLQTWQLAIDTGLRPAWAADQNALTYCGVRHEEPSALWQPVLRTTAGNYAVTLTKAQQRQYQELQLALFGTDRAFTLQMTGRWAGKLNAHDRGPGEVVMRPVFQVKTPHSQTITPHWMSWALDAGWQHGTPVWNLDGVVAAYEPVNADSLAESYINLANPGTNDAAPGVAPSFAAGVGWTFNGSTQYLTTGLAPALGYSAVVRFAAASGDGCAVGAGDPGNTFAIYPRFSLGTYHAYAYQAGQVVVPAQTVGVMALAAGEGYLNGVNDATMAATVMTSQPLMIGARNDGGTPSNFLAATITHLYIYNRQLTPQEVLDIYEAIA